MNKAIRFFAAGLIVVAFSIFGGCSCDKEGSIPSSPEERSQALSSHLPSYTQSVVSVTEVKETRQALQTLDKQTGEIAPIARELKDQLDEKLGVNIYELKAWDKVGVSSKGGFAVGVVKERPVFITYLSDRQKFEKNLLERADRNFDSGEEAKTTTVDGTDIKIVGDSPKEKVAWTYKDNLAIVGFPLLPSGFSGEDVPNQSLPPAKKVVANAKTLKTEKSLNTNAGYKRYRDVLASDFRLSVFLNNRAYLTDWRVKKMKARGGKRADEFVSNLKDVLNGIGLGIKAEQSEAKLKFWAGVVPEYASAVEALVQSPQETPWPPLISKDILAGLRFTVNWQKLWPLIKNNMSSSYWQAVQGRFTKLKQKTGIDVEDELIKQMSGHLGVFMYDFDLSALRGGLYQAAMSTRVLFGVQFVSESKLLSLLRNMYESSSGNMSLEELVAEGKTYEDIQVFKSNNVLQLQPARFYQKANMGLIATSAFEQADIGKLLSKKGEAKKLADAEGQFLGKDLVEAPNKSGLYVNVAKAKTILSKYIPPFRSVQNFFDQVSEMLLEVSTNRKGVIVGLRFNISKDD